MEIRRLNTLRGLAALIVVVSHYSNVTSFGQGFLGSGAGQFGVMLFFMLSGFLMSYLYMDQDFIYRQLCRYIVARIARVVPLFLFVVFISYGLMQWNIVGVLYNIPDMYHLLAHLFLLFGTSVLWTIPAEIQFYILFIFLWWFYQRKGNLLFVILSAIVTILIFLGLPRIQTNICGGPLDITLMQVLPYFLVGVVFGRVYLQCAISSIWQSHFYVIALLLIPLLYPNVFNFIFGYQHGMWQDMNVLFVMAFVFFLIVFLVPEHNGVLENRIGDFLGKISYSLYLLHEPILWQIKPYAISSPNLFLVVFVCLSVLIALLVYILIERPMRIMIRG